MRLSRSSRLAAALVALFSMLYMQLALAAYACPEEAIAGGGMADAMQMMAAGEGESACADMDPVQPSLCHAHEQTDAQALDKPQVPTVPAFVAIALAASPVAAVPAGRPDTPLVDSLWLSRATAPPIAIRHCCLRF